MRLQTLWAIVKAAVVAADRDGITRLGAALAFYTLFSFAPLLLIATAIAGSVFGAEAARSEVVEQVRRLVGTEGAVLVEGLLQNASLERPTLPATLFGVVIFFLGATAAFASLQGALNTVWNVHAPPRPFIGGFLRRRFLSLLLVIGVGILALMGLGITTGLQALGHRLGETLPGFPLLWHVVDVVASVITATLFFAMIYKILPDVLLRWGDVWRGAAITALFFVVGKTLVAWYLGHSDIGSVYGAAGSLVLILFWVYYSAQIVLLGAEFTQAYVRARGSSPMPAPP
jgi:membrane protein